MRSNFYGAFTLYKKEVNRFRRVWLQTVLSPLISNLLFLAVFGLSLNRTMPDLNGISYLAFLVPGLVAMGMMNNAFQNTSSSLIIAKYNQTIVDLLMIPLTPLGIQYAYVAAAIERGIIVGVVTLLSTVFFVTVPFKNILLLIFATVMLNLIFALLGILVGIWAKEFDQVSVVFNFILTPLIYLGGVFYSVSVLPDAFQKITVFNPIAYMIDILRAGFIGQTHFPLWHSIIVVVAMALVLHFLVHWTIKTGYRIKS